MSAIWYLSEENNLLITAFNTATNKETGELELWVKELSGKSRRLAEGKRAEILEAELCNIAWKTAPCVIGDGNGRFATNVNTQEEE